MSQNPDENNAVVRFDNVALGYGRSVVLKKLTFSIGEGDFLGIIGPNGSGKTTLLRAILGFVKPTRGVIEVRKGLKVGYVMQRASLDEIFPVTAQDVVCMGRIGRLGVLRGFSGKDWDAVERAFFHNGPG